MRRLVTAGLLWFAAASCGGGGTEPAAIDLVTLSGDTLAGTTARGGRLGGRRARHGGRHLPVVHAGEG